MQFFVPRLMPENRVGELFRSGDRSCKGRKKQKGFGVFFGYYFFKKPSGISALVHSYRADTP